MAGSAAKGMWMGGLVPLGYDVIERLLVVNQTEAETVREIFRRYLELGSVRLLTEAESPRYQIQSSSRKEWKTIGRESILPWCAL
jgi:site-specific DNA recombinase